MLGWLSLSATRTEEGNRMEEEGREGWRMRGEGWRRAEPRYSPTKRKLHLARTPCGVKSITDTWKERQLNPNRPWVLWLFCRELRSHPYYMQELVWSLYCSSLHGQLGFAGQAPRACLSLPHTNTHSSLNANPSATMTLLLPSPSLSFSVTSFGFQNKSPKTALSASTMTCQLQNLQDGFIKRRAKPKHRNLRAFGRRWIFFSVLSVLISVHPNLVTGECICSPDFLH